jgi:hypothetical protein
MIIFDYKVEDNVVSEAMKRNLSIMHFETAYFDSLWDTNPNIVQCFFDNKGYHKLSVKIIDKFTSIIYGFLIVGNKSLHEEKKFQSKMYSYSPDFSEYLKSMNGCCVIGYGYDERIITRYWFERMIRQLCTSLQYWFDDNIEKLVYDYVWVECPIENIIIAREKYGLSSLEYNPSLLYKMIK